GVTRTKSTDHKVMDLGCVFENERMVSNCALSQPNLSDRRGSIGKQAGLLVGVYPGPRHDLRAIPRPDLMFESIDQGIQRSLINESLLNQQRLQSLGTQRRVGRNDLVVMAVIVILCVHRTWNSRRHGSCSGVFQEPSPVHRRLVIGHRHPPSSGQFPVSRISVLASWVANILHPATSAGYWCYQNSFIPSTRSITMSEILWLVVGIRAPKGLSHDFSHPSDAYAYVVVVRSRDDVVRGNCARAGFAWRSARQSLS